MTRHESHGEEMRHHRRRKWNALLKRFFLRHLPLTLAGAAIVLMLAAIGLYFYASSSSFENTVRKRLATSIQQLTGGSVEISGFRWRLLHLEADMDGLTIHGLESAGEAPYMHIEHMHVGLSVIGVMRPQLITQNILLRDLEIQQPSVHLIVYRNGGTNQPHPSRPKRSGESAIDRLFDLKASHIAVEQGVIHYDNRAAAFDFQDRLIPLDFEARDVALYTSYVQASAGAQESYRIETEATDLNLARGANQAETKTQVPIPAVQGQMKATLDLERAGVEVRSLEISALSPDGMKHTFNAAGSLQDFTHPQWHATAQGDLDMRLIDPLTGFPYAPEGIAHLNLNAAGSQSEFRVDGEVHIDGGAYIGTGVVSRNVTLDAHLHADPRQLAISKIIARFHEGGQMEGAVTLANWLPTQAGAPALRSAPTQPGRVRSYLKQGNAQAALSAANLTIPVDGNVTAKLENVSLDTILEMVAHPPFQRLGLNALLNGSASSTWTGGDVRTLSVAAKLDMSPSAQTVPNEAPTSGLVDATYTQRDGSVDVRSLEVRMPASRVTANGKLGAYPMTSPTALSVDFHSGNLAEFDTVLRSLGLKRDARNGAAALPVVLAGQADLHGSWTGSLLRPRIAGNLTTTQIALELPISAGDGISKPRLLALDSLDATGSYSPSQIAINRAVLVRGIAKVSLSGTLDATQPPPDHVDNLPEYDGNSIVHAHLQATNVGVDALQMFSAEKLPVTGALDAEFQADGALRTVGGSGWVVLNNGTIYGENVPRVRAQGTLAGPVLTLASVTGSAGGGTASGTGRFNFRTRSFEANAKGAGIEFSRLGWVQRHGLQAAGKLSFTLAGSGSIDDPRLEAHADLGSLVLAGETLGDLEAVAHTANHIAEYDLSTHLQGAEFALHGQTQLNGAYNTDNRVEFSHFDIGALLKLAHVNSISGESALAGTITVSGPLAHTEQLHGEANLKDLEVTLAGVRLQSPGGAHATLSDNLIHLNSLHITGDNTDLSADATLALSRGNRLDLATSGSINLKLAETLDPDLTASGATTFQVEAHGPIAKPDLSGRIQIDNGSLSLEDLPNGLSQIHGSLEFNQNRLEVRTLTAMTGGGLLSVGGSLAYQHGIYADLSVTGQQVHIRYPEGITSLADAKFHLQGTQSSLLLSGDVLITRFNASPDLDLSALAAQAGTSAQALAAPDAPSNHVRLDVHLSSSPQLNFQNAYAKLAGNVDLRIRGTLASPSLIGRVSITDGSAMIAGTHYDLQSGDMTFTNPVRIEPAINLTATAHVHDYDITLGLHGTPDKLAITYHSDPPLPEADVVALLAVGHTADQQRLYTQQQEQELANPSTASLLGGALNATVSSRVQKLFGAGSVKLDPNYLGAFGNSTSRITVEEQLGRNVTLTYATDVNTTGQQLLQAEVAINSHISLVVARDESGVFSMVVKAIRRYR